MCIKKAICIASVGVMSSLCAMGNFPETDYEPGERAEIRKKNCEKELVEKLGIDENEKLLLDALVKVNEKFDCPDLDELLQRLAYFAQPDVVESIIDGDKQLPKELDILLCQTCNFHYKCCRISDEYEEIGAISGNYEEVNDKQCYLYELTEQVGDKVWELFYLYDGKCKVIRSPFLEKIIKIFKSHGCDDY